MFAIAVIITAFVFTVWAYLIPFVDSEYRYWSRESVCRRQAMKSGNHPAGRKLTTTTHQH